MDDLFSLETFPLLTAGCDEVGRGPLAGDVVGFSKGSTPFAASASRNSLSILLAWSIEPEGFVMPEALKERMDVAWEQRQIDLGLTETNVKAEVEIGAHNDAEVIVTAGLDVLGPTAV